MIFQWTLERDRSVLERRIDDSCGEQVHEWQVDRFKRELVDVERVVCVALWVQVEIVDVDVGRHVVIDVEVEGEAETPEKVNDLVELWVFFGFLALPASRKVEDFKAVGFVFLFFHERKQRRWHVSPYCRLARRSMVVASHVPDDELK